MRYKQNNNINNIFKVINKGIKTGNRLIDELDPDLYMLEDDEWIDEEDYSNLHILNVIR
jgi:hypothetical protein